MNKLNLNIKPSVWQHRKWILVKLDENFSKIPFNYILTNSKYSNLNNRTFELSWNIFENLKNKSPELPIWGINKQNLIKFNITDCQPDKSYCNSKFVGWDLYKIYKRIHRIRKTF